MLAPGRGAEGCVRGHEGSG